MFFLGHPLYKYILQSRTLTYQSGDYEVLLQEKTQKLSPKNTSGYSF
jgi:hypothetical protein